MSEHPALWSIVLWIACAACIVSSVWIGLHN